MKRFLILIACLAGLAPAIAELPPSAYETMQSEAPEVLRLNVLTVTVTSDTATKKSFDVLAEILKIGRTASQLKVGDIITIRYEQEIHPASWTGPGAVPMLQENSETIAFLKPIADGQEFTAAAGAMSFSTF